MTARLCGGPVGVASLTTEDTVVFANPDGSMTAERHLGPVRMRDAQGNWVPVDFTLVRGADGVVAPRAHPRGLRLSGGATGAGEHELASLSAGGRRAGVGWVGALPAPTLDGTRATYANVRPGIDLVVDATRTGYESFFVVKTRQALAQAGSLPLVIRPGGLSVRQTKAGVVQFVDSAGTVVRDASASAMWDAAWHPQADIPINVAAVGVTTRARPDGGVDMALTPDAEFVARADLQFPVTIDPVDTVNITASFDAFTQLSYSSDQSGATELRLGTYNGGGDKARSYVRINT